jgi:antibiotic biosynthesis monooxygenase (ABM) superfamily enzyme
MIYRIWHGWATAENADSYQRIVQDEVFAMIEERKIAGYRGVDLLRRKSGDEVEFVTVMRFDSIDAVKAFAGEDYERAVVPPEARAVLKRFDENADHFDQIHHLDYADWGRGR